MAPKDTLARRLLGRLRTSLVGRLETKTQDALFLQGRMASWAVRSKKTVADLSEVEFKVTSQWGEDGIIDWLVERAGIPIGSQTFIEFGVEDYREANTRFLLHNRIWRGYIMDGGDAAQRAAAQDQLLWRYDLTVRRAFIDRDNINE